MTQVCRNCKQGFGTRLELELHLDTCSAGQLICERCGERFAEREATEDGWHFRCPTADCDGEGLGEDLHEVDDVRFARPTR